MACQICGDDTYLVLDLGNHPLCDDLIPVSSNKTSKLYPLQIDFCDKTLTAYQKFNVDKSTLFPSTYHYRSRMTKDVLIGMQDLVNSLETSKSKPLLVDVGSNDGSLLNFAKQKGFTTIGVEPTGAHIDSLNKEHSIYNDYFNPSIATEIKERHGFPDFITFTNVFAHIDDLDSLLEAILLLIGPNTTVVIENHYLGAVIQKCQFDTFYHEHPRTYSLHSFKFIAARLGLNLSDVSYPSRYGGNIRVHMSTKNEVSNLSQLLDEDKKACQDINKMQSKVIQWTESKSKLISSLTKRFGPLPSKAFPGRAAILYKLLELDSSSISCAFEQDQSQKIDHYIPGTNIPIKPDSQLFTNSISPEIPIINNAWHISDEIRKYLRNKNLKNPIIDLIDDSDFE